LTAVSYIKLYKWSSLFTQEYLNLLRLPPSGKIFVVQNYDFNFTLGVNLKTRKGKYNKA